jgi:hypothetical protein
MVDLNLCDVFVTYEIYDKQDQQGMVAFNEAFFPRKLSMLRFV